MSLFEEQLKELQKLTKDAGVTRDMVVNAGVSDGLLPVAKPKHWTEKAREEDGNLKFFGKMLLGGFTGLTPLLFPEAIGSKARYASELDIYEDEVKHAREQAMRQQYVDVLMDPNSTHRERMAAASIAGGVGEMDPNPISAPAGTAILGAGTGEIIHNQPAKPAALPASIQEYERWVQLNQSATEAQKQEAYDNIVVAPKTLNGTLTNSMTGTPVGGDRDPYLENTTEQSEAEEVGKSNAQQISGAPALHTLSNDVVTILEQLGEYDENGNFVVGDATLDLYGVLDQAYPDKLRFGKEANANAMINQVLAKLKLSEREKLKGQGQISDSEQRILAESVSTLLSRGVDDAEVQREITRLLEFFMAKRDYAKSLMSPDPKTGGSVPGLTIKEDEPTLDDLLEQY